MYGWILLGLGILCWVSCDEGRIYEAVPATAEGGRTVKFTGKVTGMDTWPSGYTVAVAGFDAKSEYALTSANVMPSQAGEDGMVQVVMSGVTDEVTQIELCVINRIRERVVTFARSIAIGSGRRRFVWMWVNSKSACSGLYSSKCLTPAVPVAMEEVLQRQDTCF